MMRGLAGIAAVATLALVCSACGSFGRASDNEASKAKDAGTKQTTLAPPPTTSTDVPGSTPPPPGAATCAPPFLFCETFDDPKLAGWQVHGAPAVTNGAFDSTVTTKTSFIERTIEAPAGKTTLIVTATIHDQLPVTTGWVDLVSVRAGAGAAGIFLTQTPAGVRLYEDDGGGTVDDVGVGAPESVTRVTITLDFAVGKATVEPAVSRTGVGIPSELTPTNGSLLVGISNRGDDDPAQVIVDDISVSAP